MINNCCEKISNSFRKKILKDMKIFLKKLNKNLSEEEKKTLADYRRNYYLTHSI